MTADGLLVLAAIAVPIITLLAIAGLTRRVGELERSRDELVDLRAHGRQ